MKTLKITATVFVIIFAGGFTGQLFAQEMTAREIIEKVYNRPEGDDQTSNLTMTLENKSGKQRIRKIKQFTKDMGDVEKSIMFFQSPADVKNTSFMSWSYDSDKSDDQWIYLPAIKKTKRISSDSKSDYFMGSDFTIDDGNGWLGHTSAMDWKYLEERTGLMCIAEFCTESYTMMGQESDGRWKAVTDVPGIKTGWQVKGHTQASWSPVTSVWVPRKFYVIEAKPKDPYYNMGKMEFWLDKKTLWTQYKLMWDIAGEYWKTGSFMCQFMKWGNNVTQSSNMHLFYDNKTDHATVLRSSGKNIFGRDLFYEINIPDNKDQYTVGRLGTWTK